MLHNDQWISGHYNDVIEAVAFLRLDAVLWRTCKQTASCAVSLKTARVDARLSMAKAFCFRA
jgi:hypothetical protein